MKNRVVITGMGVVSPVGNDVATFWKAQCEGRSGIRPITAFDASSLATRIAGQAEDCAPDGMPPREIRHTDRFALFALTAADQAWRQSGLDVAHDPLNPYRCGVVLSTGVGGITTFEEEHSKFLAEGPRRVSPFMVPKLLSNMASGMVAIRLGLQGPNKAVISACSTGTHSIMVAADLIHAGRADVMVAGGTEAGIAPLPIAGFSAMRALSRRNEEPERASRPFDADRDGFVMGEGAGVLILESEQHACARGAEILAVVAGYGETCDAYHVAAPRPDGSAVSQSLRLALEDAQVNRDEIDYYNAHGTSTKQNDAVECLALRTVFGESMPPVSSTKSTIGHLMGAAGAVEAIVCVLAIRDGILPASINYETPDPECPVNLVANESRKAHVAVALSNSLGFGGHNASLILRRYD